MPPLRPEVYVTNLPPGTTVSEFVREFRHYDIRRIYFVDNVPQGFALVKFMSMRDAVAAVHNLNGINGWFVRPNFYERRCYCCGQHGHSPRHCPRIHP